MIRLMIDGVELAMRPGSLSFPGYDARKLHSVESWREGSQISVEVISSPQSDRVLHYPFDLHCGAKFNDELHIATLDIDQELVYKGKATLLSTEHHGSERYYRLTIRSGGSDWAEDVAHRELNDSNVECSVVMDLVGIEQTWVGEQSVRFLPIRFDSYPKYNESSLWSAQRTLMPNDYHPFLSVRHIIRSIAETSGYKLQSRWLESDLAGKLMISGAFPHVDSAEVTRNMGFKAYRTATVTAEANSNGFAFAWESLYSPVSLGPIVDSVSPDASDDEGNIFSDAYNTSGVLSFEDGMPIFTPKRPINVSFEFYIKYRTEYQMVSSTQLRGFDRVRLGLGCNIQLRLENPYTSQHEQLEPNIAYRLFIFDYDPAKSYMLSDIGQVSGNMVDIEASATMPRSTQLYVRTSEDADYQPYEGDWAIYNGFVEPTGNLDVELTVRTPYVEYTPTSPKKFHEISFYGAFPGQKITLYSGCSLRPIFGGAVGYATNVEFRDVANHRITQQGVLEALAHMFNLCLYTHEPSRTLVIEPYDDFFSGATIDWRTRQLTDEWRITEGAPENFENVRIAYAGSDGVTTRANEESGKELGLWNKHYEGYGTKQGVDIRRNPLFLPSVSTNGYLGSAASAQVLTVGNRDKSDESGYVEPRVVLYHGIQPLPEGERWSSEYPVEGYPLAAFHSATLLQTLCFDDCDGCTGLHSYYDRELDECTLRGTLRCKIRLPLAEYTQLLIPDTEGATIRSRFRLEVDGAESLFTLRSVEGYDIERGIATCLFRRCTVDQ